MDRTSLATLLVAVLAVAGVALVAGTALAHTNDVNADPQVTDDGTVLVEWEFTAADGFLVLREYEDGEPGAPIGHRPVSEDSGFRTDIEVEIDDDAWADIEESREIYVALHRNEGDPGFDIEEDPILTFFGQNAGTSFTVARGPPARVTAQEFQAERVTNGTARVRRAELPEDGFVAVHTVDAETAEAATADDIGEAVGTSEPLSAGVHGNVTVDLEDAYLQAVREDGGGGQLVAAVVYAGETADPAAATPVTAGAVPVHAVFGIDVPAEAGSTPTPTPEESAVVNTPAETRTPMPTATTATTADAEADGTGPGAALGALAVLAAGLLAYRRR